MKQTIKILSLASCILLTIACNATTKTDSVTGIKTEKHNTNGPEIKVALLIDTSNSMDGLIDQAKAQLWQIVNELSYAKCKEDKPKLKIALYEYGNDNLNADEGYLRQVLPFSNDLDEISKELFSLTTNGGNEYCGTVIQSSLNQLNWGKNEDDLKLIFIAGNEPFTQGKVSYKKATGEAVKKDVTVNTIFCGNYDQGIATYWKDGADLTNGNYMAINQNKATVHIASPYDSQILDLNKRLNNTYVAYGKTGRKKMEQQKVQDSNAESYSQANAVSRTVSKSSHLYTNSGWDMVDAENEASFSYDELKEEDLPKELKGKTTSEIKAYVNAKREERKRVQKEIQTLNTKRRNYITEKQKNTGQGNLENAMIKAIKTQAVKKNYTW